MLELPTLDQGMHLVGYLQEMGYCSSGFSLGPLTFLEIQAWQQATRTPLNHWEALAIRRLSLDYVHQLKASENRLEPPPYSVEIERRRQSTDTVFRQLAARSHDRHRNTQRTGHD